MAKSTLRKFGNLIRERRRQLDMKQEEVARRVGTSPSYLSNFEAGMRRPSENLIVKIADVLGLDAHELFLYTVPNIDHFLSHPQTSNKASALQSFLKDQSLREAHKITDQEIETLSRLAMMGDVKSSQDFLFILKTIRRLSRK